MDKKTILFYSYGTHRLIDLIQFSNHFKDVFNIIFLVPDKEYVTILEKYDVEFICLHCKNSENYCRKPFFDFLFRNKLMTDLLNWSKNFSIGQVIHEFIFSNSYNYYSNVCKKMLKKYDANLIVTILDKSFFLLDVGLSKASLDLNIPTFIPYLARWNPEANYLMVKNNPKYQLTQDSSLYQKSVFKKYHSQTYKNHFYYTAFVFRALSKLGVLSSMPWLNGGGVSNIVAIPDKLSLDEHLEMGLDKNKFKLMGDISYIPLYNAFQNKQKIKNEVIKKYCLENKKIIIIGLDNLWEHNLADKETHLSIIDKTIKPAVKFANQYTVLISLHPSMKLEDYKFLNDKYGVHLIQERVMNLLPIANIFISSHSSVISWAVLCGIKTLIVEYHDRLNLYDKFTSIKFSRTAEELEANIDYFINNEIDFRHDWDLLSKDSVFNDKIIETHTQLFHELIDQSRIDYSFDKQ